MVYRNNEMSLIICKDIARAIGMVGEVVEVHDWISLSDRSKDFLLSLFEAYSNMELKGQVRSKNKLSSNEKA